MLKHVGLGGHLEHRLEELTTFGTNAMITKRHGPPQVNPDSATRMNLYDLSPRPKP